MTLKSLEEMAHEGLQWSSLFVGFKARTQVLLPCLALSRLAHNTVTGKHWEFRGLKGIDLLTATHSFASKAGVIYPSNESRQCKCTPRGGRYQHVS